MRISLTDTKHASARRARRRPRTAVFVIASSLLGLVVASAPIAHADSGTVPPLRRTLGGPDHAPMYPSGVEIAPDGSVVVTDIGNSLIQKFTAAGLPVFSVGSKGLGDLKFNNPRDLGVDSAGNIYVADLANNRIAKLDPNGAWITSWKGPSSDQMGPPIGVSVSNDKVYVADANKKRVRVFDTSGTQLAVYGTNGACTFAPLRDAVADAEGNIYIANYTNNNILKLTSTGQCITKWGTAGNGAGQFRNPYGVTVRFDPVLNQELVYVADSNNNRFQVFTTDGTYVGGAGQSGGPSVPGTFKGIRRVAVDSTGAVYGADQWGYRINKFSRTSSGYSFGQAFGGLLPPIDNAHTFNEVRGIAFDPDGTIYGMDTVNQRFLRMTLKGTVLSSCGERGYSKNQFNWPRGIAVDQATSQVWIADTKQSQLKVVTPDCKGLEKIGGVGSGLTQLNWPHSIAIRPSDRVAWIADTMNNRILSYDVATRTPIASFGTLGAGTNNLNQPRGIAINPANGRILVADRNNNRIVELSDAGGHSMAVTRTFKSGFKKPEGVAADSTGRIIVADSANSRVVILTPSGTVEGVISDGLGPVENVAVDSADRIFVADTYNDRIQVYSQNPLPIDPRQPPTFVRNLVPQGPSDMYPVDIADSPTHYYIVDPGRYQVTAVNRSTGAIDYTAGGHMGLGPGVLTAARAIALDSVGNVYVADTPDNRVEKYSPTLTYLSGWGQKGTGAGQFDQVYGVAVGPGLGIGGTPAEVVYTVDADRVQKWTPSGQLIGAFAAGTPLHEPRQITVEPSTHRVYVVNARDHQIVVFDESGTELLRFGSNGRGPGQFSGDPRGVAVADNGDIYVTDSGNKRIQCFDSTGQFKFAFGSAGSGPGQFVGPRGLTVTTDGKVAVADEWHFSIEEFTATGTHLRHLFGGLPPIPGVNSPRGMAVDSSGRIFTTDWWNQRIVRMNADGSGAMSWGFRGAPDETGSINFAWDVALQPGTNRIFIANRESHEIEVFTTDGVFVTRWGSRGTTPGKFTFPQSVAFMPDGSLLVTDSGNARIERFSIAADGTGTFVESYGSYGNPTDGPGKFDTPAQVDVAPDGTIWVADTQNSSIQKRSPSGVWTRIQLDSTAGTFKGPWGVTVAPDGAIWVADTGNDRIVKMDTSGNVFFTATGATMGAGDLDGPFGIEFGQSGQVYVSDTWNNRVVQLELS